ncbi:MAG: IS110 family transposase [Planctomycetaceae bacterium]
MQEDTKLTIGIDLGDKGSRFCVLGAGGAKIEEGCVPTSQEAFRERFGGRHAARVVIETGTHSPWASRLLQEVGHEVIVANARQVKLIHKSHTKSDRLDAERLARLGRIDPEVLSPVRHRGAVTQADLETLRARATLVEARTKLGNHVRGAVKSFGARLPKCSTHAFPGKVVEAVPQELRPALEPILAEIETLSGRIAQYDRRIERMCRELYVETERLRQVPGVGPVTALAFVLTLEDPGRFAKSRQVGSYLGLRPRQSDSGEHEPQLPITKAGDLALRTLLVQCAHYILGPFGRDSDLRRHGLGIATRGGKNAKRKAVVAVARKLAVLLHRLWVTGATYDPLRNTRLRERMPA